MKTKRNTVKVNPNGSYAITGLNRCERESLISKRNQLKKRIDSSVVDQYIIALYSEEENEVYFIDESSFASDERAILIWS